MQLIVLTSPHFFPGEAGCLEALLAAGLQKLHLRKPGAGEEEMGALIRRLSPSFYPRLVLHASEKLAERYGIPQIHLGKADWKGRMDARRSRAFSASLHSWEEMKEAPGGLEYVFMSPLFDSISKPGYPAGAGLLRRPEGPFPCPVIGLGGIRADNIGQMIQGGWEGAALLGWIWEEPSRALERYQKIKDIVSTEYEK